MLRPPIGDTSCAPADCACGCALGGDPCAAGGGGAYEGDGGATRPSGEPGRVGGCEGDCGGIVARVGIAGMRAPRSCGTALGAGTATAPAAPPGGGSSDGPGSEPALRGGGGGRRDGERRVSVGPPFASAGPIGPADGRCASADATAGGGVDAVGSGGGATDFERSTSFASSAAALKSSTARMSRFASDAVSAARRSHFNASDDSPRPHSADAVESAQLTSSSSSLFGAGIGEGPTIAPMVREIALPAQGASLASRRRSRPRAGRRRARRARGRCRTSRS